MGLTNFEFVLLLIKLEHSDSERGVWKELLITLVGILHEILPNCLIDILINLLDEH